MGLIVSISKAVGLIGSITKEAINDTVYITEMGSKIVFEAASALEQLAAAAKDSATEYHNRLVEANHPTDPEARAHVELNEQLRIVAHRDYAHLPFLNEDNAAPVLRTAIYQLQSVAKKQGKEPRPMDWYICFLVKNSFRPDLISLIADAYHEYMSILAEAGSAGKGSRSDTSGPDINLVQGDPEMDELLAQRRAYQSQGYGQSSGGYAKDVEEHYNPADPEVRANMELNDQLRIIVHRDYQHLPFLNEDNAAPVLRGVIGVLQEITKQQGKELHPMDWYLCYLAENNCNRELNRLIADVYQEYLSILAEAGSAGKGSKSDTSGPDINLVQGDPEMDELLAQRRAYQSQGYGQSSGGYAKDVEEH